MSDIVLKTIAEIPMKCKKCFAEHKISYEISDTQSYKIAGNAIEINTMRSIIRQLYKPIKSSLSLF